MLPEILGVQIEKFETENLIRPHHGIHTLDCIWQLIYTDKQLRYLMQKFPNLQSLKITCGPYMLLDCLDSYVPFSILVPEFLHYVTNIPKFDIDLIFTIEDFIHTWSDFINTGCRNIAINLSKIVTFENIRHVKVRFNRKLISLNFGASDGTDPLQFMKILSNGGRDIRTLILLDNFVLHHLLELNYIYDNMFDYLDWIFQALKLCPLLKKLELHYFKDSLLSNGFVFQHLELETLSLTKLCGDSSLKFLKDMSVVAPNLKRLNLSYTSFKYNKSKTVFINMPNTFLDILTWKDCELKSDKGYR